MDAFVSGVDYQDNAYISSDDNDDLPLENLINSSDDDEPLNYSTFEKCVSEYRYLVISWWKTEQVLWSFWNEKCENQTSENRIFGRGYEITQS